MDIIDSNQLTLDTSESTFESYNGAQINSRMISNNSLKIQKNKKIISTKKKTKIDLLNFKVFGSF